MNTDVKHAPVHGLDKSGWAVGGGLLLGTGVGFFFLEQSALYFVGCILAGLGAGLMAAALASRNSR